LTGTGAANSPGPLSGTDPEDGAKGAGSTFTITDTTGLQGNTLLYNGVKVVPGVPIPNYNPSLLTVTFSGAGSTSLSFYYSVTDASGTTSPSVAYAVSWSSPLPLDLMSFTATKSSDVAALISWTTANEQNTDRFIVERSSDTRLWNAIGSIKAAGNSTGEKNYGLTDAHPLNNVNYYRLRILDQNGSYSVSFIRQLTFEGFRNAVSFAPNPATSHSTLSMLEPLAGAAMIKVWNSMGQLVIKNILPAGTTKYDLDLHNIAKGIYLVSLDGAGINEQIKLEVK
jgi:hypothetical protein